MLKGVVTNETLYGHTVFNLKEMPDDGDFFNIDITLSSSL